MVKFIKQEADEKANEIAVSAEEVGRAGKPLLHNISMLHTDVFGTLLLGRHSRALSHLRGCAPGICQS